jgi:hypothetical protein
MHCASGRARWQRHACRLGNHSLHFIGSMDLGTLVGHPRSIVPSPALRTGPPYIARSSVLTSPDRVQENAERAIAVMNGEFLGGRLIRVTFGNNQGQVGGSHSGRVC